MMPFFSTSHNERLYKHGEANTLVSSKMAFADFHDIEY